MNKYGGIEMSVEVGKQAPNFTLKNQDNENVSLADFRGKNIVLYFYPKDMTPGCTTQACDFRDAYESFSDLDDVILGVSPDPIERHQTFIDTYALPFHLLADEDHKVDVADDLWKVKNNFGRVDYGSERSTFIIEQSGQVINDDRKVRVKDHVQAALDFLNLTNAKRD